MISFVPLCSHLNPEKVLIVGGGDGGVAREVVKHPLVKEVHQIEIDNRVVELSKLYLPNMSKGFESDKLSLTIGDGFSYMDKHKNTFDVIITDSSDPVGPAVNLFNENYFELMKCALREGGIICSQGGSYWLDCEHVKTIINRCKTHFPKVAYCVTSVPSYPCGHIGFVIGSLDKSCILDKPVKTFDSTQIDSMGLKYYTSSIHSASFILPRWIHKHLYE